MQARDYAITDARRCLCSRRAPRVGAPGRLPPALAGMAGALLACVPQPLALDSTPTLQLFLCSRKRLATSPGLIMCRAQGLVSLSDALCIAFTLTCTTVVSSRSLTRRRHVLPQGGSTCCDLEHLPRETAGVVEALRATRAGAPPCLAPSCSATQGGGQAEGAATLARRGALASCEWPIPPTMPLPLPLPLPSVLCARSAACHRLM